MEKIYPPIASYSNLNGYSNSCKEKIMPPVIVNSIPKLFILFNSTGHKFAQPVNRVVSNKKDRYLTVDKFCKN